MFFTKLKEDVRTIELAFECFKDAESRWDFLSVYLWSIRFLVPQELITGKDVPHWAFGSFFSSLFVFLLVSPVVFFQWVRHGIRHFLKGDWFCEGEEDKDEAFRLKLANNIHVVMKEFFPFYVVPNKEKDDYILIPTNIFKDFRLVRDAEA